MGVKAHVVAVTLITVGCSSGPNKIKDGAPVDVPTVVYMAEYVDWNSTDTAFCGIMGATFQVHGDATRIDHTPPNGRVMLNVTSNMQTQIDITPPTTSSGCLVPTSTYTMPGVTFADPAVIATGQIISMRDFSVAAQASLATQPDAAKGHVFVHVDGTPRAVAISASSDPAIAWNGTAWAAGTTGINVFFENVAPGMTSVTTTGSAVGTGMVPVQAGTITYVTLVLN